MLSGFKNKFLFYRKRVTFLFLFVCAGIVFLLPEFALAGSLDLGMEYGNSTMLPSTDPRIVIARLIQVVLGFLGILAVSLVIYGGFLWMTSEGNPEKVDKAKRVLKNAIIGLIIILASFGIATFVLNQMLGAMDGSRSGGGSGGDGGRGLGAIGSCSVQSVYPSPQQKDVPRNTSIMVSFKEEIDPTTICDDADGNGECNGEDIRSDSEGEYVVRIYKSEDDFDNYVSDVRVDQTSDNKTFVFTPEDYLGSPSEYIWYSVYMSNDIQKSNGKGAFSTCQENFLEWQFEVSNKLDLTPPEVDTVFPPPDDEQDDTEITSSLSFATGEIVLNNNPEYYVPATTTSVTVDNPNSSSNVSAEVDKNCEQEGTLRLAVESDGITATLENVTTGKSLGSAEFQGDTVTFDGILSFTVNESYEAGHSWEIGVQAKQPADSLNVNADTYTFVEPGGTIQDNQIEVGGDYNVTASNIASRLNSRDDLIASSSGDIVNIKAAEGGSDGNDILIEANDNTGDDDFTVSTLSGGSDEEETVDVNDKRDKPKNAIIQINFNEAVSPLTVSGSADDVSDSIRVINADSGAAGAGSGCTDNSDCVSFDCDDSTGQCVGDHLAGRFLVSNKYQTVEFQSDNKCGTNACGEDIYCLPENSNIRVEMEAAHLDGCTNDCSARSPYNDCESSAGSATGNTCVDDQGTADTSDDINYPMANLPLDGVADAANNSLNGNKTGGAEGPISYYDENIGDDSDGDSYTWSFWTNDKLMTEPPEMSNTTPSLGDSTDNLIDPIEIDFNTLMQSSSLNSGETRIDTGDNITEHKLINLWNFSGSAVGYWISQEGIEDEPPIDGYPNRTRAFINHSMFSDSVTYRSQVGSGVKDIYQNCYKPSAGPDCTGVDDVTPSCCNGTAVPDSSCN